jgi:hypothetical protein
MEEFGFDSAVMFGFPVNTDLYLAPIKCGTWLGERDSSLNHSWFRSPCASILQNRDRLNESAKMKPCGLDSYTTGCRVLGQWVQECRTSKTGECGVQIPCPPPNPCGLDPDINVNLNNAFHTCTPTTFLALNVTSTAESCNEWSDLAFLLNGRCVSSCGNVDSKCTLGGKDIPRCNTVRTGNTISSISPTVCAVPVRSDSYGGVRNGFFGMSRLSGSKCLLSTNCSNIYNCSAIEGINVTSSQPFILTDILPPCTGDLSKPCKIETPCTALPIPFTCDDALVGISELIYSRLKIYDCIWFKARDIISIILWALSCVPMLVRMEKTIQWLEVEDSVFNRTIASLSYTTIFAALATIWEVTAVSIFIGITVLCLLDCNEHKTNQPPSRPLAQEYRPLKPPQNLREVWDKRDPEQPTERKWHNRT